MSLFNSIKNQISILSVIEQYTNLKKAGLYYKAVCPFHYEKTASFTVSPHKDIFYCFGCHAGGDVITFIEKAENCSALQAAHLLVERYNLVMPQELATHQEQRDEKKQYHVLMNITCQWLHNNLKKSPAILRYLKDRGINQESIVLFNLGYFPSGKHAIHDFIAYHKTNNILVQDLVKFHLLLEGKNSLYSPFEDRIIFPIRDHLARPCGLGGRIYIKDDTRVKYYNSHENSYFTKGSLLFGFDLAKKSIAQQEAVFLVEGYTDCIAMVQHGFTNTVATLGTACTLEHLQQLARYTKTLYVMYDGDAAGQKAILRLTEFCWRVNIELNIVQLPPGEDPASLLKNNVDMLSLVEKAQDIFSFFLTTHTHNFFKKGLSEKVEVIRAILHIIIKLDDPLKQDILLQQASHVLNIPIDSLQKEIKKTKSGSQQSYQSKQVPVNGEETTLTSSLNTTENIPLLEKKIFSVIINARVVLQPDDEQYLLNYFCKPLQKIYATAQAVKATTPERTLNFNNFFDSLSEEDKRLVSNLMLESHERENQEDFMNLLWEFQKKNWQLFVADIKKKLQHAQENNDLESQRTLLNQFQELKKKLLRKEFV